MLTNLREFLTGKEPAPHKRPEKARSRSGERDTEEREGGKGKREKNSNLELKAATEFEHDGAVTRELAEFGDDIMVEDQVSSTAAGGLYQGRNERNRLVESEVFTSFVRWYYLNEPLPWEPDREVKDNSGVASTGFARVTGPVFEIEPSDPFISSVDSSESSLLAQAKGTLDETKEDSFRQGGLSESDSVQVDKLTHAFDFREPGPGEGALRLQAEGVSLPWSPGRNFYRLRFALMGRERLLRESGDSLGENTEVGVVFNPEAVIRWRLLDHESEGESVLTVALIAAIPYGYRGQALYDVQLKPQMAPGDEVARFHLRFTSGETERQEEIIMRARDLADRFENASLALQLSTLAAQFTELQRRSYWAQTTRPGQILSLAREVESFYRRDVAVREWLAQVRRMDRNWTATAEGMEKREE